MSALAAKEHQAWLTEEREVVRAVVVDERRFLRRHLAAWFPMFSARVAASDDGFYSRVVGAAHAFVVHDADLLLTVQTHIEAAA